MKKPLNRSKQYIGQLVAVNTCPDGQIYTIAQFDGNNAVLQWREGNFQTRCTHDRDCLTLPTLEQIENAIADDGLVSWRDVKAWDKEPETENQ
jgi:hypothetical protein